MRESSSWRKDYRGLELAEVGVPNGRTAKGETHQASGAPGVDEAGLPQFAEVVRDGGGG